MDFQKLNQEIAPVNSQVEQAVKAHWDGIAKPLDGLGQLEKLTAKIGGLTGDTEVRLDRRVVVVLCADNGVVAEGVTQTDASVTAVMAGQIHHHQSSVCRMAAVANADVFCVDMGMLVHVPEVSGCHVADGTRNFTQEPAMTPSQAEQAILYGMKLVRQYKEQGYQILVTGEMGIGNTTASSAMAAVLLKLPVEQVTGRGAGLSDEGLMRKQNAIKKGIAVNQPDSENAFDVLCKLGGFDIAGMVGLYLGGAKYRVPVIVDGLISSVAALTAARLCPNALAAMIPSHSSMESAEVLILRELGLKPLIYADLKLGEGTGAVCMLPLLDMALSVFHNSAAFSDTGIEQYEKLGGDSLC